MSLIEVGSMSIDYEATRNAIRKEWEARKPNEENPAGLTASRQFSEMTRHIVTARDRLTSHLEDHIETGREISSQQISDLKQLEKLSVMATMQPESPSTRAQLRNIENGERNGSAQLPRWKKIENQAGAAENRPRDTVTITTTIGR